MTDKPVSHKRPVSKTSRVALPHLKKAEPQRKKGKQNLRPLTSEEKFEIVQRLGKGQSCQKIASEMGIPFVLVQRQQNRTTSIVGQIERLHHVNAFEGETGAMQIAGIEFVLPPAVCQRLGSQFFCRAFVNGFALELQVEFNGETFVVLNASLKGAVQ